jgi:hypothetical protein
VFTQQAGTGLSGAFCIKLVSFATSVTLGPHSQAAFGGLRIFFARNRHHLNSQSITNLNLVIDTRTRSEKTQHCWAFSHFGGNTAPF